ncbi:MAG TPA: PIG-L family deacetylase [Solirubrobacteraceae bacterium]
MKVLALSPHLDDAVFSCGATLARLAGRGAHVMLVTAFTRSMPNPDGFALACQTDKGLAPDIDYMAMRRAEDRRAAHILGIAEVLHLDLPEAPHRGYLSTRELFGPLRREDDVEVALRQRLVELGQTDLVLAPRGLGDHVDHRQLVNAVASAWPCRTRSYRDIPYALRLARPERDDDCPVDVAQLLGLKLDACAAYATQLEFQFGGEAAMRHALSDFAAREGRRLGVKGQVEALSPLAVVAADDRARPVAADSRAIQLRD